MTKDNPKEDQDMSNVRIIEEEKDPTDPGRAADPETDMTLVLHRPTNGEPHDELTREGFAVTIEDDGLPPIMNNILHQRERSWGGDFTTDVVTTYHDAPRQVIVVGPGVTEVVATGPSMTVEVQGALPDPEVDAKVDQFIEAHETETKKVRRRWRKKKDT